ncbi:outer membrane lipoprotein chaperone LolA [Paraglaciecola sp.]|uniref:outer membrane lipoprotein chaperone LolA n=1 Tax=Paraglaciecola sp. TaxID=1920173 RepID=UPI003EF83CA7
MKTVVQIKSCVFLVISMMFSVYTNANTDQAKQLLQSKLLTFKSYQANFVQTVVDLDNTVLQQANGILYLQQPNKLRWELFAPNESTLIADGESLWNLDPFMEQVVAYKQSAQIENNPLILLTDSNSDDWDNYQVSLDENKFVITPKEALSSGVFSLTLMFDNEDKLTELSTIDSQGQASTLKFSKILQNTSAAKSTFIFSLPKGWELDDQRAP